jgi:hypothetical protein
MHLALDEYVASRLTATDAESQIEHLFQAIERIGSRTIEASRHLSARLVYASAAEGALVPCVGDERPEVVLNDFRTFIDSLAE